MKRMLITLAIACFPLSAAFADPAPQAKPPGEQWEAADLRPMQGKGETFASTTLVTAAYGFIWVAVLGFVASVWLRGRRVERELGELRAAIERRPSAKG